MWITKEEADREKRMILLKIICFLFFIVIFLYLLFRTVGVK